MKTAAIVQARMGSSRLPGKVLQQLGGRPMLEQVIRRLQRSTGIDQLVIATSVDGRDDPIEVLCRDLGVDVWRGSENDVLDRYLGAALNYEAEMIVRVTADCPLIDPSVVDSAIREAFAGYQSYDYVSNIISRTYPRGLDVEVFPIDVLKRLHRLAQSVPAREHVTYFLLQERPDLFSRFSLENDIPLGVDLRWTVDEPADLKLMRHLYEQLNLDQDVLSWKAIYEYVSVRPALKEINSHVAQKHK